MAALDGLHGELGEFVAALVFGVAGVAFDPLPDDLVTADGVVEGAPEVGIFHGLFGGGFPLVAFPAEEPLGDAVADVLGVGVQGDGAGFGEELEGLDGGAQFHAVVGGGGFAPVDFLAVFAVEEDCGPSADAGIAVAAAVGVDDDLWGGFGHDGGFMVEGDWGGKWKMVF